MSTDRQLKKMYWLTDLQKAQRRLVRINDERAEACWNHDAELSSKKQRQFEKALSDLIVEAQLAARQEPK